MNQTFEFEVEVSMQEDGIWRASVLGLQGCFVDAPTLAEALSDIQPVAAMHLDLLPESSAPLPDSITSTSARKLKVLLPLARAEHVFRSVSSAPRQTCAALAVYQELRHRLRRLGFRVVRQGRSHEV